MMLSRMQMRPGAGARTAPHQPSTASGPHLGLAARPLGLVPARGLVVRRFREDDKPTPGQPKPSDKVKAAGQAAKEGLSEGATRAKEGLQDAASDAKATVQDLGQQAGQAVKGAASDAKATARDLGQQTSQAAKNAGQAVRDAGREAGMEVRKEAQQAVSLMHRGYYGIKVPFFIPALTRRREVFIGRLAMVAFMATCIWEAMSPNHIGPIMQVCSWSGLWPGEVVRIIGLIVAYNTYALLPFTHTFSPENQADVAKRPYGPGLLNARIFPLTNIGDNLGISFFGFTKRNELFQGRLAMLAWVWTIVGEITTGNGPMAQLANNLGMVADDEFYGLAGRAFYVGLAVILALSYTWGSRFQGKAEEEIY